MLKYTASNSNNNIISALKLVSGELIIGKVNCFDGVVTVYDPMYVNTIYDVESRCNFINLYPYNWFSKSNVLRISISHVMICEQPVEEILEYYNSMYNENSKEYSKEDKKKFFDKFLSMLPEPDKSKLN